MAEWTAEIRTANRHLEEERKERKRAEEALQIMEQARLADQRNIELHHRLNEQSEKERRAIGRELHNGPIQTLASAGKGMETIPDLISQTANGHFGLAGMKERAEAAGGEFHLQSHPGKGTTIRVTVPITN